MSRFSTETFRFLSDLSHNNSREWFQENRPRYDQHVRDPAVAFILAVGERLGDVSAHLRADPRPVGGSLFRIHRDVRFSKDKRPYKTATGIQFRHARGKDAHAPGLYLHIEPRGCFVGVGVWHPDAPALRAIRERIAEDPAGWGAVVDGGRFAGTFELAGESLSRPPRGFDPGHPRIEDLKRKDFIAVRSVPQSFVTGTAVVDDFLELAEVGAPLMRYLCGALGVPF